MMSNILTSFIFFVIIALFCFIASVIANAKPVPPSWKTNKYQHNYYAKQMKRSCKQGKPCATYVNCHGVRRYYKK